MTAFRCLLLPVSLLVVLSSPAVALDESEPGAGPAPEQPVGALDAAFDQHRARAVHATGIVLQGGFAPGEAAASIGKAPQFQQAVIPIVVRFSNLAGVPDNAGPANPRGLAVKFRLPDGLDSDIVSHSFNGFPSATAGDFREFVLALAASGHDTPKPSPIEEYLDTHPRAKAFAMTPKPAPASDGTLPSSGVNAFRFIDAKGEVTHGRDQFVPPAGSHFLSDEEAGKTSATSVRDEIAERVRREPVRFRLMLQVADKADTVDDPSIAWPDSRWPVELGTVSKALADNELADNELAQSEILLMPNRVPAGIKPADPMIAARASAYPISFNRRQ